MTRLFPVRVWDNWVKKVHSLLIITTDVMFNIMFNIQYSLNPQNTFAAFSLDHATSNDISHQPANSQKNYIIVAKSNGNLCVDLVFITVYLDASAFRLPLRNYFSKQIFNF